MYRRITNRGMVLRSAGLAVVFAGLASGAQTPGQPVVLDSVVAVVNNHAILSSDIQTEIQLSVLDPERKKDDTVTPQVALQQLISRALIQQQIREEDVEASEPKPEIVSARLAELRKELPACVRADCASDQGWKAFLKANGLDENQVITYMKLRLEILGFIENRFRQGIRIPDDQVEAYYRNTLLPQYGNGERAPALSVVAPRISEILLEQRVNALFDTWLDNLTKQGDVEILDPKLQPTAPLDASKAGGA